MGIVSVVVNPDSSGVDFFKLFERREWWSLRRGLSMLNYLGFGFIIVVFEGFLMQKEC